MPSDVPLPARDPVPYRDLVPCWDLEHMWAQAPVTRPREALRALASPDGECTEFDTVSKLRSGCHPSLVAPHSSGKTWFAARGWVASLALGCHATVPCCQAPKFRGGQTMAACWLVSTADGDHRPVLSPAVRRCELRRLRQHLSFGARSSYHLLIPRSHPVCIKRTFAELASHALFPRVCSSDLISSFRRAVLRSHSHRQRLCLSAWKLHAL